ncbi:response regulator [Candidatus Woesearchaeota archaeon]|nr:response regulator [Candidatus Woesearchaeota archaeon]
MKQRGGIRMANIVVADDEPAISGFYRDALEMLGHTVYAAGNGREAASLLEELTGAGTDVGLVITDYNMPGMSGIELLQFMSEGQYGMQAIMISSDSDNAVAEKAESAGAAFYKKPIRLQDLIEAVESALAGKK